MTSPSSVRVGDSLRVKREFIGRGGEWGEVISVHREGASLDFYESRGCEDEDDGVSIEFWEWGELELPNASRPPSSHGP